MLYEHPFIISSSLCCFCLYMEVHKLPPTAPVPQSFPQSLLLYSYDLFSVAGVQAAARRAGPGDWARAAGGRDPHGAPGGGRGGDLGGSC